ncbi:MAG: hypothetical protein NVS3B20_27640 [Polyangiales bacterium]
MSTRNGKALWFERIGEALGAWVVRHRAGTVVLCTLFFAIFAFGVTRAKFSTDYRVFFSKDDPGLASFQHLESVFTKTDNVLFVVKAKEGNAFSRDTIEAVQELTKAGWQLPHASRVDSLANFQHARVSNDDIEVGELIDEPARSMPDVDLDRVREVAVHEALVFCSLVS